MFEDLLINIRVNQDGVRDGINGVGSALKGLKASMNGINQLIGGAKLYVLADGLAKCIKASMDMTEIINLFNVSMGDTAIASGQALTELAKITGLDLTNLEKAVGNYTLLGRSMGMTSAQASQLGMNTTKLAIDLSSLTNVPIDRVMQDLRSGLLGQSETVYKYGIDVTEAGLKTEAMNQGITKSVRDMSQGEKMALRYSTMIRQSGLAQGDFANTINTPANQLRILSERFVTLSRSIGSIFMPMLGAMLPYLNALVSILIDVADAIAKFFGFEPPKVDNSSKSAIGGLGDDADASTKAIDKTAKAMKNLNTTTLGMDELHLVDKPTDPKASKDAGGGASILPTMQLPDMKDFFSKIKNISDDIKERMIPALKEALKIAGLIALAFISWEIAGLLINLIKILPLLQEIMLFTKANGFFVLSEGAMKLWKGIQASKLALEAFFLRLQVASGIFGVITGIIVFFKGLYDVIKSTEFSWKAFLEVIGGIALIIIGILLLPVETIVAIVAGVVLAIIALGTYMYKYWNELTAFTSEIWGKIADFFVKLWADIVKGFSEGYKDVSDWFTKLGENITKTASDIWTNLPTFFAKLWKDIVKIFSDLWTEVVKLNNETLPKLMSDIVKWFADLPNKIAYALGFVLGTLLRWNNDMKAFIDTNLGIVIDAVVKFFTELPAKIQNELDFVQNTVIMWRDNLLIWFATNLLLVVVKIIEVFSEVSGKIYNELKFAKNTVVKWGVDLSNWFNEELPKVIESIIKFWNELPAKIKNELDYMKHTISEWKDNLIKWSDDELPKFIDNIIAWIKTIPKQIKDEFIREKDQLLDIGKYLGDGIMEGLNNIGAKIASFKSNFLNGFKTGFDINSPSKVMRDEVGVFLGLGIMEGLDSTTNGIIGSATSIASGIQSAFTGITLTPNIADMTVSDMFANSNMGTATLEGNYNSTATMNTGDTSGLTNAIYNAVYTAMSEVDLSGQVIENVVNLDGEKIYKNQQEISRSKGVNFGMGVFTR